MNLLGLILNIIGTAMIWKYGVAVHIDGLNGQILVTEDNSEVQKQGKRIKIYSNIGMGLILLGFILQAAAAICEGVN